MSTQPNAEWAFGVNMPGLKNLYTCPKCGHSVGWRRRWLKSGIFTQWLCKNCGTTLEYDCWKSLVLIPMFVLLIYAWIKPQVHVVAVYFFVFFSFWEFTSQKLSSIRLSNQKIWKRFPPAQIVDTLLIGDVDWIPHFFINGPVKIAARSWDLATGRA